MGHALPWPTKSKESAEHPHYAAASWMPVWKAMAVSAACLSAADLPIQMLSSRARFRVLPARVPERPVVVGVLRPALERAPGRATELLDANGGLVEALDLLALHEQPAVVLVVRGDG